MRPRVKIPYAWSARLSDIKPGADHSVDIAKMVELGGGVM